MVRPLSIFLFSACAVILAAQGSAWAQSTSSADAAVAALNSQFGSDYATFSLSADYCTLRISYKADNYLRGRIDLEDVRPTAFRVVDASSSGKKVQMRCHRTSCAQTTFHGRADDKKVWESNAFPVSRADQLASQLNRLAPTCAAERLRRASGKSSTSKQRARPTLKVRPKLEPRRRDFKTKK